MKPPPDRLTFRLRVFAGAVFVTSLLPVVAAEPATPTVTLDKLVVSTTPDYRPLEPGWQVADLPGFRIFSHGNDEAKTVAEQLQLARAAFSLVWKDETLLHRPITVVLTANQAEFLAWTKVAPAAMDLSVRAIATPSGLVMVVNGGFDAVYRAVGRSYVLALLQDTKLPRWLQEGIAQISNSVEVDGDRLRVGKVQQDVRNSLSLDDVRELANNAAFSSSSAIDGLATVTDRFGRPMDIRINGIIPTQIELERYLNDEVQRRRDERTAYKSDTDFFNYLADRTVMSLDKVFDPQAVDSMQWRMTAWGFTHYSLFADKQSHRDALSRFVRQLEREPSRAPVEVLKETYGQSASKLEMDLLLYGRGSKYSIFDFKLAEPFRATKPALENVPEANVLLLRARVLGATNRTEEARQLLAHGYANPENRTPFYVSQFTALEREKDPAHAAELLEDAARREQLDNFGRRQLATARLERLQQAGKLQPNDLRTVLLPLFAALEQGDQSEELFVLIGRAWAASAVPPKPEHLNALRLGLTYYPKSQQLAELLRQLERPT